MHRGSVAPSTDFNRKCGCINHALFTNNGSEKFQLRSHSYFHPRKEFSELLRRDLVYKHLKYVCTVCLSYARNKLKETNKNKKCDRSLGDNSSNANSENIISDDNSDNNISSSNSNSINISTEFKERGKGSEESDIICDEDGLISRIINLTSDISNLKWDNLDDEMKKALSGLSAMLGSIIRTSLDAEKTTMAKECSSFDSLLSINRRSWYGERNLLLRKFLEGCSGVNQDTVKDKKFNSCVHSIEQVMYTQNNNMITPFSFQRNIISYLISKSRTVSTIMGSWESSGSYTKIVDLLSSPSDPIAMPKSSDITITFDNEQKVGRHSGRLREGSKQPISIITTVATIKTNPVSSSQFSGLPMKMSNPNMRDTILKVDHLESEYKEIMHIYRARFLEEIFKSVLEEQYVEEGTNDIKDYVDIAISHDTKYVCRCRYISEDLFENCPSCHSNSSFHHANYDKYSRTESLHLKEAPEVKNAEPFMLNPSSRANVETILSGLHEEAIIRSGRKWVSVVCDDVPYTFAAQIQDFTKLCSICFKFIANHNLDEHSEYHEFKNTYASSHLELLFRPGPGHIEMNMSRLLLQFLWTPFFEDLANSFGFRTIKAKNVFRNGVDHHRSRELLWTCLMALGKELVVPYVRYCVEIDVFPSCEGYMKWYDEKVNNRNYAFLYHVTFSYLLAFHLYNESVRKNNTKYMMAARTTFSPLFYISHHPRYQMLLLRDICQRVNYSPEAANYMAMTESFSVSGRANGGQGGDFIHEEVNKVIKSFLPPVGLPSKETWRNIIRKTETLKKMKNDLLLNSAINFDSEKRPKNHEHEMTMIRRKFRKAEFFQNYHDATADLVSLSGETLDFSLCDFNFIAQGNYETYKKELIANGTYGTKKLEPVFITSEDRAKFNSIEVKTIDEIKDRITSVINDMPDKDMASSLREEIKLLKNKRKHQYISKYYEYKKVLDEQIAERVPEGFSNEDCDVFK